MYILLRSQKYDNSNEIVNILELENKKKVFKEGCKEVPKELPPLVRTSAYAPGIVCLCSIE